MHVDQPGQQRAAAEVDLLHVAAPAHGARVGDVRDAAVGADEDRRMLDRPARQHVDIARGGDHRLPAIGLRRICGEDRARAQGDCAQETAELHTGLHIRPVFGARDPDGKKRRGRTAEKVSDRNLVARQIVVVGAAGIGDRAPRDRDRASVCRARRSRCSPRPRRTSATPRCRRCRAAPPANAASPDPRRCRALRTTGRAYRQGRAGCRRCRRPAAHGRAGRPRDRNIRPASRCRDVRAAPPRALRHSSRRRVPGRGSGRHGAVPAGRGARPGRPCDAPYASGTRRPSRRGTARSCYARRRPSRNPCRRSPRRPSAADRPSPSDRRHRRARR